MYFWVLYARKCLKSGGEALKSAKKGAFMAYKTQTEVFEAKVKGGLINVMCIFSFEVDLNDLRYQLDYSD